MKPASNGFLSSILLPRSAKCKFAAQCSLFTKTSTTCMNEGGNYCGKYRAFSSAFKPLVEMEVEAGLECIAIVEG